MFECTKIKKNQINNLNTFNFVFRFLWQRGLEWQGKTVHLRQQEVRPQLQVEQVRSRRLQGVHRVDVISPASDGLQTEAEHGRKSEQVERQTSARFLPLSSSSAVAVRPDVSSEKDRNRVSLLGPGKPQELFKNVK
jgi:hypothetical protein